MNPPEQSFRVVGTRPVRPDGADKVTGRALYGTDFALAGMLHGAVLRSPHAHARIRGIDASRALALPGVKAVVTGADFPEAASVAIAGESAANLRDIARNVMARDKALYEGHAVAAVAATSPAIARAALALIAVDYEVLPHATSIAAAIAPDAPLLHDDLFTPGLKPRPETPSNLALHVAIDTGDAAAALAGAAAVAGGHYTTQPVHQGYIEPHACVAQWNADGQAQIWASSQGAFMIRSLVAGALGLKQADIRVTPLEIGGGFGGKTTVYLEPVALQLARQAGRPVRLEMSRSEVFRATGPAPGAVIDIRLGADKDGMLVGAEMTFHYTAGAFPGAAAHPAALLALAGYKVPNRKITGWEVVCNLPSSAAYRAPGAPQVAFAVESCLDELALQLGIDPIELRLKNAVGPGDTGPMGLPHGQIGLIECLEAARAHPHYSAPLAPGETRGVAAGGWANYGGPSTAAVALAEDGSVLVTTGSPDIGGSRAAMAMMAAETLGVPYETVRVTIADTASIGFSFLTGGSRTTFATGHAVIAAANQVIATARARAAQIWGVAADTVAWRDGAAHGTAGDSAGKVLTLAEIAGKAANAGGPISAEVGVNPAGWLPGFGVHICDCALDAETGQVKVTRYTAIQDVGRAIHPAYVEGQLQGGAAQGIGWALNEAYVYGADGRMENPGFLDYRVPVASDLPMIDTVLVDKPNPDHPYGVKGVGETPIVPPLAAVANAVSRAAGRRQRHLPMSPEQVLLGGDA
ncbi:MAG: xanthine dehydrogenase family protein molybdopterin-binding subunit [Proteobacteria bacterium]|nr:xanthine dehydrogenase family protein molybdopterin-binding subunit [Pseudomonadota bacterium]